MHYSAKQFIIFRIIFGSYLAWHFYTLIPYNDELFGPYGMIPNPEIMPNWKLFSLISFNFNSEIYLYMSCFASVLFATGLYRRTVSFLIWYGWSYLLNRNILILNPGIPYVGWLLLASAIIPDGEGDIIDLIKKNSPKLKKNDWYMPSIVYWSAWFLMALGYTISGIHKLQCESWINGTALQHILSGLLARHNFITNLLLASPLIIIKIHTWLTLAAEILFLPLGLFYHVRKWYWLLFIVIQLGILLTINFTDLTLGVLMIHIFTFDNRWLKEYPFKLY